MMMMMMFRDLQTKKPFTSLRLLILFVIQLCECHLNRFDLFDVTISSIYVQGLFFSNYSKKKSITSFVWGDIISGEMIFGNRDRFGTAVQCFILSF